MNKMCIRDRDGVLYAGPVADFTSAVIVLVFIIYEMKKLNQDCLAEQGIPADSVS